MKLQVEFEGNTYDVDVEVTDKGSAVMKCGYIPPSPGVCPAECSTKSRVFRPKRKVRLHGDDKTCRSPMCGTVRRVYVEPGQLLQPDDVVLVLEAMKMESNITAGRACVVKSVNVAAGDGVKTDQVMVEFE